MRFLAGAAPLACLAVAAALAACSPSDPTSYQGYAEGEFVLVAAPSAGTLQTLAVTRGQQVAAGAPLFELEHAAETAAVQEVQARLAGVEARLANLKTGRRDPEVDVARAQSESAQALRRLSELQLEQQERLYAAGFISKTQLDEAKASHARDQARVEEAQAQVRSARQSVGRDAEIRAAQAEVAAARAALAQAQWRLAQTSPQAGLPALVHDTYFSPGEWVPAGAPVVSLLPPGNLKLRFFVPEAVVATVQPGQQARVQCDGCGAPIAATVSYVSPQPEYTPPILYSKESRAKLVFLVEAKPARADAARLKPGQPVDVTLSDTLNVAPIRP